jgi:crotonobetainyl-CoA:carnitine CoA-transferase CaiB-like acyl-CoA transferase
LLTRGVPAAPAFTVDEFFEDPWAHDNHYFDDYDHPQFGKIRSPHGFATWGTTPAGFERRSPLLGEHSAEVLRDFGFSEERVSKLLAAGAVRQG